MAVFSSPRYLGLRQIHWKQDLLSGGSISSLEEMRSLSIHAKPSYPQDWFRAESLYDLLIEVNLLMKTATRASERQSSDQEGEIGFLRYCKMGEVPTEENDTESFVGGEVAVSESVFNELWERVKLGVGVPSDIWLLVSGMTIDPSPLGNDYWDLEGHPKLSVVSVKFSYSYQAKCKPSE